MRARSAAGGAGQDGAVALEAALVAPLLALLVAALLAVLPVAVDQLAVAHAARAGARAYGLSGERAAAAGTVGRAVPGAVVEARRTGREVVVTVRLAGRALGIPYAVAADAVAVLEPGVP